MTKNNNDILKKAVKTVTVSTLALAVAITIDKTAEVDGATCSCHGTCTNCAGTYPEMTIQCFDNVVVLIVHDRIPSTNFTIKVNHD